MGDNTSTEFRKEGQPAFPAVDTENDNSAASSAGEKTNTEGGDASGGHENNSQSNDSKAPLNQDPRWSEREQDWKDRFNAQEVRHQDDLQKLREEFGGITKKESSSSKIPAWFGGNQEQWDAYRNDFQTEMKAMGEQAEKNAYERIKKESSQETKLVEEATTYMRSEMAAIEADKTLNPTAEKIDPNKLLKFVLENDLVDSKGRWNYRAGYRLMKSQTTVPPTNTADRKKVADATMSDSKADKKGAPFKTAADFKKARPW